MSSIKHQWNHFLKEGHFWASVLAHNADTETNGRFLLMLVEPSPCLHTWLKKMKQGWGAGLHLSNDLVPIEGLEVFRKVATEYGSKTFGAHHSKLRPQHPPNASNNILPTVRVTQTLSCYGYLPPSGKQLPKLFVTGCQHLEPRFFVSDCHLKGTHAKAADTQWKSGQEYKLCDLMLLSSYSQYSCMPIPSQQDSDNHSILVVQLLTRTQAVLRPST